LCFVCQYLYFCTSKASKLHVYRPSFAEVQSTLEDMQFVFSLVGSSRSGGGIYVYSIRQHTSACVSIFARRVLTRRRYICIQYTSACVSMRQQRRRYICIQHTSACVSMRQDTSACVRIRQHASAYVSMRQHASAYVSMRQHTSAAYVSIFARRVLTRRRYMYVCMYV
jgi:hypothetical protein